MLLSFYDESCPCLSLCHKFDHSTSLYGGNGNKFYRNVKRVFGTCTVIVSVHRTDFFFFVALSFASTPSLLKARTNGLNILSIGTFRFYDEDENEYEF